MAGAALLAGASVVATRAYAKLPETGQDTRSEELAMVLPRQAFPEGDDIPLPKPLPPEISTQIKSIFRLQRQGAFAEAITSTTRLTDATLLGDIEADRYLNPAYHPGATELRTWLKKNVSYADATAIWARLAALPQRDGPLPPMPVSTTHLAPDHTSLPLDPLTQDFTRSPLVDRALRERTSVGLKGLRNALHLITATPGITAAYAAQLQAETAQAMLDTGETDVALEISRTAFERSQNKNALAGYVAGLALWQQRNYEQAAPFFEKASHVVTAKPEMRATCAFWAARTHEKMGQNHARNTWLQHAEAFPATFYGLLASHILHHPAAAHDHPRKVSFSPLESSSSTPSAQVLTEIDIEAVGSTDIGRRVFALLQVGEQERAENTIRRAWSDLHDVTLARSFQLVANAAGLHDLSAEMSEALQAHTAAQRPEQENLPLPLLKPRNGFIMDPALVYAMTRLESNFDPQAVSRAGAHGLMQIRAVTADFVTSGPNAQTHRFENAINSLHDPSLNLEIGQRYMQYLADRTRRNAHLSLRGGDMIRLLASYNAGPSALARWENRASSTDDPLLFMELIPNTETRDYVHRALSYLWIYAAKLKLPTPSLSTLARNEWPDFADEQALAHTISTRVLH